jgi:hypothetical protein
VDGHAGRLGTDDRQSVVTGRMARASRLIIKAVSTANEYASNTRRCDAQRDLNPSDKARASKVIIGAIATTNENASNTRRRGAQRYLRQTSCNGKACVHTSIEKISLRSRRSPQISRLIVSFC